MDRRLRVVITLAFGLSVGLNVGLALVAENALEAHQDLRRNIAAAPTPIHAADQTAVLGPVHGMVVDGELRRLEVSLEHVWATPETDLAYAIVQILTPNHLVSLSPDDASLSIQTIQDEDGSTQAEPPRLNGDDKVRLVMEPLLANIELEPDEQVEITFMPAWSQTSSRIFVTPATWIDGPLRLA